MSELRVLTWNLFHGRAVPSAGRSLRRRFAETLARWDWDVALLQEVPPWWPATLASAAGAEYRRALTSRNWFLPVQRLAAERFPDVLKSAGGGANVILARRAIRDHHSRRLRWWPERRVLHAVRLGSGVWVANLHATVRDQRRAEEELRRAHSSALDWAQGAPVVLGGDFNLWRPEVPGFIHAARHKIDHVFARGLRPVGSSETLERGDLSDHAPVVVSLSDS